jgi:hypothetical protein
MHPEDPQETIRGVFLAFSFPGRYPLQYLLNVVVTRTLGTPKDRLWNMAMVGNRSSEKLFGSKFTTVCGEEH